MICVLEGTGADSCTVPKLPVVEETEISEQVKNSCFAFKGTLGARNGVPGGEYEFDLVADVCPGGECGEDDFRTSSKKMCEDMGMLPVCDHPSYCKDDANAWYIGQDHHISHGSHMQNNGYFPSGWNEIKTNWYGTCMYSFNANGPNSLCNNDSGGNGNGFPASGNPWGSHAWLRPSQTQTTGKDGLPNKARQFMCASKKHRSFTVALGARNGVPAQTVEFKIVTAMDKGQGEIDRNMIKACNNIGMKPVCDHPNYCKDNAQGSIYIGQDHHFSHSPHRRTVSYFPSGWQKFVDDYYPETRGICAFTAHHNGWASTLCNGYGDSHEWRTAAQDHEFMCAKVVS